MNNTLCRNSFNSKSPYEAILFLYNEDILKLLNCYYIEPDNVDLSNNLLNKNNYSWTIIILTTNKLSQFINLTTM